MSNLLVDCINGVVQDAIVNNKWIDMEAEALGITIQKFRKKTLQWLNIVLTFNLASKINLHLHLKGMLYLLHVLVTNFILIITLSTLKDVIEVI